MKSIVRAVVVPIAAALVLVTTALPAGAAQQQNANVYASWNWGTATGTFWNIDQNVWIQQRANYHFWAGRFFFNNSSVQGGYLGIQQAGRWWTGETADVAVFSLWGANGARGANGGCNTFVETTGGWSCKVLFTIRTDRFYKYRVWRQETDALGQWWGAWIIDTATGIETSLGGIRMPYNNDSLTGFQNFTEYFGPAVSLPTQVPKSTVDYTQPAANYRGNGVYQWGSTFAACSGGTGALYACQPYAGYGWTVAERVSLGGTP